ncbi:Isoflavone reductase-like protein [Lachnellula suecica]|uniref:Isoflavone reductase-like protein n=1 Tax=Lachnellula suecica TaxID=602035 RepID=A0A8T9CAH6_9HELO|nr:Isoflavone reductase-like protein [Lachnellula suecica]
MLGLKNVAVIGAGGNLGPFVTEKLAEAGFHTTIIIRPESKYTLPDSHAHLTNHLLRVKRCAFDEESLTAAFHGQDVVVVMIGKGVAILSQKTIIDAAARAGVKRFFPSEFGSNTLSAELLRNVPAMKAKAMILTYLQQKAAAHPALKWTAICNGAFFDWGLTSGFLGFNLQEQTANIYGSGNQHFHATMRSTIGLAIVSALRNPDTENKYLYISNISTSQRELLSVLEMNSGSPWKVTSKDVMVERAEGMDKLARQDFSGMGQLILADLYGEGKGTVDPVELDNELLGLEAVGLERLVSRTMQCSI